MIDWVVPDEDILFARPVWSRPGACVRGGQEEAMKGVRNGRKTSRHNTLENKFRLEQNPLIGRTQLLSFGFCKRAVVLKLRAADILQQGTLYGYLPLYLKEFGAKPVSSVPAS
jgi:hypothetical protein